MDDAIRKLIEQGYTADEAELVKHVCDTARAERDRAQRTGRCECGAKLRRMTGTLECAACGACHAA